MVKEEAETPRDLIGATEPLVLVEADVTDPASVASAAEDRGLDVTANVVAPSTLDTPANRATLPASDSSPWVPPADVAAISFLASDTAGQLRGARLLFYGSA
jgi:hypothetical protein